MKKALSGFVTTVMLVFLVSCGGSGSNVLTGIQVSTSQVGNDTMMSFAANINLGGMSFASISLPILHPRGQTPIGSLELVSGLAGQSQIKINVNMSEVADINVSQAVLPNGNAIPLIANNPTIAIKIGGGARVYLTLGQNVTAIGVAVPISAFDNIGQSLPGLNFFPIVQQGDVIATAGIFTGMQAGQNGIAVVADVSRVVNLGNLLPSSQLLLAKSAQLEESQEEVIQLDYRSQAPAQAKERRLKSMLATMSAKKLKLRMR